MLHKCLVHDKINFYPGLGGDRSGRVAYTTDSRANSMGWELRLLLFIVCPLGIYSSFFNV